MKSITVSVWYRERIMLPPGSRVEVHIEDTARADAPATVISSSTFVVASGPPYDVVLDYDPAMLEPHGCYAVRASIEVDGRLRFTTTEHTPAFDHREDEPLMVMMSGVATA